MISVIICSANAEDLILVKKNIAETIGVAHEIIAIDNRKDGKGICEVYNAGTKKAQYEILCYMHEDIEYITENWGKKVLQVFQENEKLGLLGIAGGGYKSLSPSSWYNYYLQENGGFYCNLIQGYKRNNLPESVAYINPKNESLSKVACVDGCWFCTRRELAIEFPFDEKILKGFHGYDLDFSLGVSKSHEAAVTFEILLRHFSEGNFDKTWMREIVKVHKKWSAILPLNVEGIPEKHLKSLERHVIMLFLQESLDKGYFSKGELVSYIWKTRKSRIASFSFPLKLILKLMQMKANMLAK